MPTTEGDARGKICPQSFGSPAAYRLSDGELIREPGPHSCLASGCMAWRWAEPAEEAFEAIVEGWKPVIDMTGRKAYLIMGRWTRPRPNRCGYCGLAGKAEG